MHATKHLSPGITTMIRMDHTQVLATFHKYRLDAAPEKKQALVETICTALEIHAQLEEEIFYPAMRNADAPLIDKSVPEHQEMRRLIAELRAMPAGGARYDETFMQLMRDVIHHVADEETRLLPDAERVLKDRLAELGWAMTRRRMELAKPRAGEIAVNVARSYPAAVLSVAAVGVIGAVLAGRALGRRHAVHGSLLARPRRLLGHAA
jgi:hemerythrin superfamily protein